MGCISSKHFNSYAGHPPPHHYHHKRYQRRSSTHHSSSAFRSREEIRKEGGLEIKDASLLQISGRLGPLEKIREEPEEIREEPVTQRPVHHCVLANSKSSNKYDKSEKKISFSIKFGRLTVGEHAAAGWPVWLAAVAGEAIEGWLPLKSYSFEILEKIGQGTYSSVYRARDRETGRMVAVKKVKFDNSRPVSVRFMAKEISILRNLDHPNIMKLEGIITSQSSTNICLVFEYMEHDLAGLLSSPDIKFSESEIKCYMQQLLSGVEYCHSRGIMHRDIKSSNILVNNNGILKIADFGLANFLSLQHKQPLTSCVVTLWYRPPELSMGSTNYDAAVDLWSTGCVLAELFIGRPLFKGRTERSKLPLAPTFKPQQPYASMLRERCIELPNSAVKLIETFLSIEPHKRGTASAALQSDYFTTKPYACHPSSIPKYPPNKEIDAKFRDDARRKMSSGTTQASGASRNSRRVRNALLEPRTSSKVPVEEVQHGRRSNGGVTGYRGRATTSRTSMKGPCDTLSEASQMTEESQNNSTVSVPVKMSTSSSLAWGKPPRPDSSPSRLHGRVISKSHQFKSRDTSRNLNVNGSLENNDENDSDLLQGSSKDYRNHEQGKFRSGPVPVRFRRRDAIGEQPRAAVSRSRFYRDL